MEMTQTNVRLQEFQEDPLQAGNNPKPKFPED
jgi:hypothetical protein